MSGFWSWLRTALAYWLGARTGNAAAAATGAAATQDRATDAAYQEIREDIDHADGSGIVTDPAVLAALRGLRGRHTGSP